MEQELACPGVLVVEDDSEIAEMLTLVLEDEGYKVNAVRDGREALAFLRTAATPKPCVILLDLMMPRMNGLEFRSEQLRDPAVATVPVVLVTAEREARGLAREMNVAATLIKPVDLDELLSVVGRYCARG